MHEVELGEILVTTETKVISTRWGRLHIYYLDDTTLLRQRTSCR